MFKKIEQNIKLHSILTSYCAENGVEVSLSPELDDNSDEKLLILKADDYYSSQIMHNPPPAIDCIILVKCDSCDGYDIYLVELKDIKSPSGFNKENIKSKFQTVIDDFLQNRFKDIFINEKYCNFNCYFVTNPYRCKSLTQEEYSKKIRDEGLKLDYFNSIKPFRFQGKISFIQPILPNPMIKEC
jgi:hypothetical protein